MAQDPDVLAHLRTEYRGVFDERQLERHIQDHLGEAVALELVDLLERRAPDARRLLDLGCGYGSFIDMATRRGIEAVGVDRSAFELGHAVRAAPGHVLQGDAFHLPFADETFDCVTAWNVLEHVADARRLLVEAVRVTARGGSLFLLAPNYLAVRREAHYHVPWAPFLNGRLGERWLRVLGRDPQFWREQVHPCTLPSTRRTLRALGLDSDDFALDKLLDPGAIRRPALRRAIEVANRVGLRRALVVLADLAKWNPLRGSIAIHARRP